MQLISQTGGEGVFLPEQGEGELGEKRSRGSRMAVGMRSRYGEVLSAGMRCRSTAVLRDATIEERLLGTKAPEGLREGLP